MPRSILVLCLHPDNGSFNSAFAAAVAQGARGAGHTVNHLNLAGMVFDPDLGQSGFAGAPKLEPDLEMAMAAISAADHLVLIAPMWWGGLPAKAKGLFDRAFLPGRAFDPRIRHRSMPKPLLTDKTARLILTSDTPQFFFRLLYGQAMRHQIEGQILRFTGILPAGFTHFAPVGDASPVQRGQWLDRVRAIGARGG